MHAEAAAAGRERAAADRSQLRETAYLSARAVLEAGRA